MSIRIKIISLFMLLLPLTLISQEKVKLPIKNDYIYYRSDFEATNTKKCLSQYFDNLGNAWTMKMMGALNGIMGKNNLNFTNYTGGLNFSHTIYPINCADTLEGGNLALSINLPIKIKLLYDEPTSSNSDITQRIGCKLQIMFHDKNTYSIIFKGFTYVQSFKRKNSLVTESFSLEEVYKKYSQEEDYNKNASNFYDDLNKIITSASQLINDELTKMYKVDDL